MHSQEASSVNTRRGFHYIEERHREVSGVKHNNYMIHDMVSLRYFMTEAYDVMPLPKAVLPAFVEVLGALDDADYNGVVGITVEKETFDKVAAFIGTTADFKMRQSTEAMRTTVALSPEELTRLSYESPRMLEEYYRHVEQTQADYQRAVNFSRALHRRTKVSVPRSTVVERA